MTEPTPGAPLQAPRTILCAIQYANLHEPLRTALAKWDLTLVSTAYEALRELNRRGFDAYVVTYWLPDLPGIDLCHEIRKVDPHAPICVVSTTDEAQRRRALRAGADAVMLRTDDPPSEVGTALDRLFGNADARNDYALAEQRRAIQAELDRQSAAAETRHAKARAATVLERAVKTKALRAFIGAGGTRAAFERTWPAVLASAHLDR